jgi:hypothetical protein
MAKLTSNHLTLEIRFREFDKGGWVQYEVLFLWQDQPLVNDALLKRDRAYWNARSTGAFKANDYERDDLIATIEKVLETNQPEYWQPLEPDVTIAIYPGMDFPFLESHWQPVEEDDACQQVAGDEAQREPASDDEPQDDWVTLIVVVDTYNLKDARSYSGEGLALIMRPTRQELEVFCADLKREYQDFAEKYKVNEYEPLWEQQSSE